MTSSIHRPKRPAAPGMILALASSLALACASSRSSPAEEGSRGESLTRIADELVGSAELRADLSAMRVHVARLVESDLDPSEAWRRTARAGRFETVPDEVRSELVLALSRRLHVLDPSLAGETDLDSSVQDAARQLGATHVVLASYVHEDDTLLVTTRLVDAKSLLIVASARGRVPIRELTRATRTALVSPHPLLEPRPASEPLAALDPSRPGAGGSELAPDASGLDEPARGESAADSPSWPSTEGRAPLEEDAAPEGLADSGASEAGIAADESSEDLAGLGGPSTRRRVPPPPSETRSSTESSPEEAEPWIELPEAPAEAVPGPASLRLRSIGRALDPDGE